MLLPWTGLRFLSYRFFWMLLIGESCGRSAGGRATELLNGCCGFTG